MKVVFRATALPKTGPSRVGDAWPRLELWECLQFT